MHVEQQLVESMQFAQAQITEQSANVYQVLGENPSQHAHHVRSFHLKVSLFWHMNDIIQLLHVCMLIFSASSN